jgi:hypothetical protein
MCIAMEIGPHAMTYDHYLFPIVQHWFLIVG